MELWQILALISAFQVLHSTEGSLVQLKNNGYEDIVIAINPRIPEDVKYIERIKEMVTEASTYLLHATKQRLFIRSAKILIPQTWPENSKYERPKTESYDKADVIIADPFLYGDDPYTLQYGGCGDKGKYIHLTPNFLLNNKLLHVYGPRGRVFVHEWAHLRWGVFDEYNDNQPYYLSGQRQVEATRCPMHIIGQNKIPVCQGTVCKSLDCEFDSVTGLYEDGCMFLPEMSQTVKESIMYSQGLPSVHEFCNQSNHNTEAPNQQNRMCHFQSTWDVIMQSPDMKSTSPLGDPNIPAPSFSLLQYKERVVTLVLDVSGSMEGSNRIGRMYQAAEVFIMQIVESGSYVGIVKFSSAASIESPLVKILDTFQREKLKLLLPTVAQGGTHICSGIVMGLQVNKNLDGSTYGTEIIILTDGEDNFDTSLCFPEVQASGAIIHTIALGLSASKALEEIADLTGGLKLYASDVVDANGLIDSFSGIVSNSGNISQQSLQIESTAVSVAPAACLTGAVTIDSTVGNDTFFLVTWDRTIPNINLNDPKGKVYMGAQFVSDTVSKSARLIIPGTAERGSWKYSLCNSEIADQVIGITVNSRAADADVPPIVVNTHMNTETNSYPNPMVVYALVNQGLSPVLGAKVTATIEPQNGNVVSIELMDNGAGADITKNDGVYSRYFISFSGNGRYNLKVRVESQDKIRLAPPKNRALYLPGYVINGTVVLNAPKPVVTVNDHQLGLETFSRTSSGGAFVVSDVPLGVQPDIYKPERITDLDAGIKENSIVLYWTATGDDMDQGNASRYDLRMSTDPRELRENFANSTSVNISSLTPLPAGSRETFTFIPENIVIQNGTILYFALIAFDEVSQKSDLSNIAQAALFKPQKQTHNSANGVSGKLRTIVLVLVLISIVSNIAG
ncbi:calcium-activated chloride channel regulator 1-like [Ascaphus truei]|uniref:calcium-activated chloride channel regulator 1-like n=1 Tax=Ascaphus truei TaxID=8439 RepID=UPI003F5AC4D9